MRALLMAFSLLLAGCAAPGPTPAAAAPRRIDDAMLPAVDAAGAPLRLVEALDAGKAVALVFWQTWCASCRREAPLVSRAATDEAATITFVGVVPGRDDVVDAAEVERTRAAWAYDFPQARDRDLSLSRALGVDGTPTIVVIGPDRTVRFHGHHPPEDWRPLRGAPADCEGGVCPLPPAPAPGAPEGGS